ncbi:MAG: DUF1553 domain-containing protein [Chloroflexi bacterium]|nr:DUF1553 domain-containing protein [Chloroflexota bacterium]
MQHRGPLKHPTDIRSWGWFLPLLAVASGAVLLSSAVQAVGSPAGTRRSLAARPGTVRLAAVRLAVVRRASEPAAGSTPSRIVGIECYPSSLTLNGPGDERRALVSARLSDGAVVDVTDRVRWTSSGSAVRAAADGYLTPAAVGDAVVIASVDGVQARLPVSVKSVSPQPVSFVRDVMPVISKAGCNAGTCHGSAKGKNGFKLSLRGYDPEFDFRALIDDIAGRRFNRVAPEKSLILAKPTEQVPHQGGMVFEPGSRYYRLIRQWIMEGVHSDAGRVRRVNRIEVIPASLNLAMPGQQQQMLVIAHYPDGSTRDVTRDAVFTSSMPDIGVVSPGGQVTAVRRGEAAVLVRYEGNYGVDNLLVMGDRSGYHWSDPPVYNYIDRLVYQKLKRVKVLPSPLCTDAEFLRRVSLDLVGIPPTPSATRQFLADPTPGPLKRTRLIDQLLSSPDYVDNWTNKWSDLLECNDKYLGPKGVEKFHTWIHDSIQANKPYDRFVHDLITASGSSYDHPAAAYYRIARDPSTATENVTQLFLGTRFSCNKCHDHPFERWTQQQYYQFGAFFADVAYKPGKNPDEEIVTEDKTGKVIYPRDGRPIAAVLPFGSAPAEPTGADPRTELADWLTSPQNPLFARSIANRIWSYFFGRGIIDPVDDIRSGNPPSNPELLDALTKDLVQSGFDLKHLMKTICESRVYQLSLLTNRFNADDAVNFSHASPRRLTAEELLDALSRAAGSEESLPGMPAGARACQVADTKTTDGGSFLALFGSPPRESPCECERSSQVSLRQALNLVNGGTLSDAISSPGGRIASLIARKATDQRLVEEIFLAALCRYPKPHEITAATQYLQAAPTKSAGAQDLMWGLLTSPEFLFNH